VLKLQVLVFLYVTGGGVGGRVLVGQKAEIAVQKRRGRSLVLRHIAILAYSLGTYSTVPTVPTAISK
jgi:hypothetical protein